MANTTQSSDTATAPITPPFSNETLYQSLESHPFNADSSYLSGLQAILNGPHQTSTNQEDLILHARCFYYMRAFNTAYIDAAAYKTWRSQQPAETLSSLDMPEGLGAEGSGGFGGAGGAGGVGRDFVPTPEGTPSRPRISDVRAGAGQKKADGLERTGSPAESTPQAAVQEEESAPVSFQQIMELIREGEDIPGIKDVPDTVLLGQGTEATKGRRQKPWEQRAAAQPGGEGLFAGSAGE